MRKILTWCRNPIHFAVVLLAVVTLVQNTNSAFFVVRDSFSPPVLYQKDFLQEYVLGRALLTGVAPYQPVGQLAQQFGIQTDARLFPHATPHPMMMGLMGIPFAYFSYEQAARLWWMFCLLGWCYAAFLFCSWWNGGKATGWWWWALLLGLAWDPLAEDAQVGQINVILLVLLLWAWRALATGRDVAGGVSLGMALALKMTGWPIVLFLCLRQRWRAALAAAAVFAFAQMLMLGKLGWGGFLHYYQNVAPAVTTFYRTYDANISLWTVMPRFFAGTGTLELEGVRGAPLMAWGFGAKLAWFVPLLVLLWGLWRTRKMNDFELAFGLLVTLSLILNPVAWHHYLVMALIPLLIGWKRCLLTQSPNQWLLLSLALLTWVLVRPHNQWQALARWAGGENAGGTLISGWAACLTLIPLIALLTLCVLIPCLPNSSTNHHTDDGRLIDRAALAT